MHKKVLTSLMALLYLTTLTTSQEEECGGPLSTIAHENISYSLEYLNRCSFPTYKMNLSCVLSSCPKLSGVCPLTSTKTVNPTTLNTAVSILNTCLGQDGLICGINMSHIPLVQIGWSTRKIVPLRMVNGTIWLNPGTGYQKNLSSAKFTLPQTLEHGGLIRLNIQAPNIIIKASHTTNFTIPPTSTLRSLSTVIPTLAKDNHYCPNMIGTTNLNISSGVSIDLSTSPPTINILDDHSNIKVDFSNLNDPITGSMPSDLVILLNSKVNDFVRAANFYASATTLLATYAALSLQAAQLNCTS